MWSRREPLSRHTTFGIGGRAALYCRPASLAELEQALDDVRRLGLEARFLGGGSNLLVDDGELDMAVIHISSPALSPFTVDGERVTAGGGMRLGAFLKRCARAGLGGLEPLAGIPGRLGGAVVGNAGAHGVSIGDCVRAVTVVDDSLRLRRIERAELVFGYRSTNLRGTPIVDIELALVRREPETVRMGLTKYREWKRRCHPIYQRSAGCVFKNPNGDSAGRLIDLCDLKGARVGGAEVSDKHANFIVNRRGATARDVLRLVDLVRATVQRRFGVSLEMEIEHWAA